MKKMKPMGIFFTLLCVLILPAPVFASDMVYTFSGTDVAFATPTSTTEQDLVTDASINHNRSKSAAYIPPQFGSMTSYTLDYTERLTPNLIDESVSKDTTGIRQLEDDSSELPSGEGTIWENGVHDNRYNNLYGDGDVLLTENLYYSAGHIGRLYIPKIDVSVKVYESESQSNMKKGVAHMEGTGFWSGNVVLCGHNRGESNYFEKIHKLEKGDKIYYRTKLGEKVYEVVSVTKIHETNQSVLLPSVEDKLTLLTCVRNESEYRYAVKAVRVE